MALAVLAGLAGMFGWIPRIGGATADLFAVQAAGEAQAHQTSQLYRNDMTVNMQMSKVLSEASEEAVMANAKAGKYALTQSARSAFMEAQMRAANQWMRSLVNP